MKKNAVPLLILSAVLLASCDGDSSSSSFVPVRKDDIPEVKGEVPSSLSSSILVTEESVEENGDKSKDPDKTYKERWTKVSSPGSDDPYTGYEFTHRTSRIDIAGSYTDDITAYTHHTIDGKYYAVTRKEISGYSDGNDPVSKEITEEEFLEAEKSYDSFYEAAYAYYGEARALLSLLDGEETIYSKDERTVALSRRATPEITYYLVKDTYDRSPVLTFSYTLAFYETEGEEALLYVSKTKTFFYESMKRTEESFSSYSFAF
jgi:hypothetical protein